MSEENSRRNSIISHSSFDRFVLDEVMVARAMIKTVNSLSDKQQSRVLKLKEGILHKAPRKTPNSQRCKRKENDFGMEGWSHDVPPRDPPVLPFGLANKAPFLGDTMKESNHLKSKDALKNEDVGSKPSMEDKAFHVDHEQDKLNQCDDLNGYKDEEAEDKSPERCNKLSENLSDNSSVDESEESLSGHINFTHKGKKTPEQHVHAPITLPPLLQPSAFQQKQKLPAQSTKTGLANGKQQQANSVSLKQFHWSPSESHTMHKYDPETSLLCYPHAQEINKRNSWKIILEDASKLDGYKKMYADKKKRTETEMFSKPDGWKQQEPSYLQKRLKALSYGRVNPSRGHSIESKDFVQSPTVSLPPDQWNFSSTVSLAQRMHGSRKIMEKEFPLVHYDTKSNSMSNLSEWTKARSIRPKGCQQRALQCSQLQLNLPAQYSTNKTSSRKDTPI